MSSIKKIKRGFDGNILCIRYDDKVNTNQKHRNSKYYGRNKGKISGGRITNNIEKSKSFVEKAIKEFKHERDRRLVLEKLADAFGYACKFEEKYQGNEFNDPRCLNVNNVEGDPDFSKVTPKKWLDRDDKSESVVDFVLREYNPWIGKNLVQYHIKNYDKSLYNRLSIYHSQIGISISKNLGIPSKKEVTDIMVKKAIENNLLDADGGISDPLIKAAFRLKERERTRQRRSQQRKLDR